MKRIFVCAIVAVGIFGVGCEVKKDNIAIGKDVDTVKPAQNNSIDEDTNNEKYTSAPVDINESDLELGQMKLGIPFSQLESLIREKPIKITESVDDDPDIFKEKILEYADGLTIVLYDDEVYSINTTNGKYATPRNMKVGDSKNNVVELYGEPDAEADEEWIYYYGVDEYPVLYIKFMNEKVIGIQVSLVM